MLERRVYGASQFHGAVHHDEKVTAAEVQEAAGDTASSVKKQNAISRCTQLAFYSYF